MSARVIELGNLYKVDPQSLTELVDAAVKGVRAEAFERGWHVVLSFTSERPDPWRFSARKLDRQADPRFPFELLKGLSCPKQKLEPLAELADQGGYWHWAWSAV